jgi:aquaporin Z
MRHAKLFAAEFIGTLLLTAVGLNAVINGSPDSLGIALSIGLTVMALTALVGPVSGAHLNPLVTIGFAVAKKVDQDKILTYLAAQILGGLGGGLVLFWIARGQDGGFSPNDRNFAISGWELVSGSDWVSMALTVGLATALLVGVYVAMVSRGHGGPIYGIGAGITYTAAIYFSLGVVGISVNPAMSFGTAVFAGGDAFKEVWLIMLFGVIGAVLGLMMFLAIDESAIEDTMLGDFSVVRKARDVADSAVDTAAGAAATAAGAVGTVAGKVGDVAEAAVDKVEDAAGAVKDKLTGDD